MKIICFASWHKEEIQHINQYFINIAEIDQNMPISFTYFDYQISLFWVLSCYFKSAKVIKLRTLYLSNVKKFYNDLTWPIKFIKHIYIYSQILSYLSIKIDIYNFRIFIQRHFLGEEENRLYREMKKELFLCMTNSK